VASGGPSLTYRMVLVAARRRTGNYYYYYYYYYYYLLLLTTADRLEARYPFFLSLRLHMV